MVEETQICLAEKFISTDTETDGLRWFDNHKPFVIVFSTARGDIYVDLRKTLQKDLPIYAPIFNDPSKIWFLMNAKFDMHMLSKMGYEIAGEIHDIKVLDRILYNQHLKYNLASIAKRHGFEKLDEEIDAHIKENNLFEEYTCPRTGRKVKNKRYDLVSDELMQVYAPKDGSITRLIAHKIIKELSDKDAENPEFTSQRFIVDNESKLVKTLYKMEKKGVQLDPQYLSVAFEYYKEEEAKLSEEITKKSGIEFSKGDTFFQELLKDEKHLWQKQASTDNWKWDKDTLQNFKNPIVPIIQQYAEAKKQLDYFENLLFHADKDYVLHAIIDQAGTKTGRMSSYEPNIQNLTDPDKYEEGTKSSLFPVRRAFIPRPGKFFLMLDYKQVEYRVFLDKANAKGMIQEVLAGLDVHEATAKLAGVSRKEAKVTNFLEIYGGGTAQLVKTLFDVPATKAQVNAIYKATDSWLMSRMSAEEKNELKNITLSTTEICLPYIKKALAIKKAIKTAAPEMAQMTKGMQKVAESRGFIFNHFGRRCHFPDKSKAYAAANSWVQGTCADILKVAMNNIDDFLRDKESSMLLPIHDELVFEMSFDEIDLIPELINIMKSAYNHKYLPLEVDAEYSLTNLADKKPWNLETFLSETKRDFTQGKSAKESEGATVCVGP